MPSSRQPGAARGRAARTAGRRRRAAAATAAVPRPAPARPTSAAGPCRAPARRARRPGRCTIAASTSPRATRSTSGNERSTRSCSGRSPSCSRTTAIRSGSTGSTRFSIVAEHERARRRARAAAARARASCAARTLASSSAAPLAERRQLDAAAALGEQRLAELLLQAPHVAADRRLGQVQRVGRAVVAAVADDRQERAEMGGVEVHAAHRRAPRRHIASDRSRTRIDLHEDAIGRAPRGQALWRT